MKELKLKYRTMGDVITDDTLRTDYITLKNKWVDYKEMPEDEFNTLFSNANALCKYNLPTSIIYARIDASLENMTTIKDWVRSEKMKHKDHNGIECPENILKYCQFDYKQISDDENLETTLEGVVKKHKSKFSKHRFATFYENVSNFLRKKTNGACDDEFKYKYIDAMFENYERIIDYYGSKK